MTIEEKRKAIKEYCNKRWREGHNCSNSDIITKCPLYGFKEGCWNTVDAYVINRNYDLICKPEEPTVTKEMLDKAMEVEKLLHTFDDSVNHPNHYNRDGAMESIDEMVLVFGKEAVKNFCLCNVWKYRYRATDKNGIEDLKKSDWYIRKYKELCANE